MDKLDITKLKTANDCGSTIKKFLTEEELNKLASDNIVPHYRLEHPLTKSVIYLYQPTEVIEWLNSNYLKYQASSFVPKMEFYDVVLEKTISSRIPFELLGLNNLMELPIKNLQMSGGIYFLCLNGKIQYIGQSVNIAGRVGQHVANPEKEFDSVFYFNCPKHCLDDFETALICKYTPPLNRNRGNGKQENQLHETLLKSLQTELIENG